MIAFQNTYNHGVVVEEKLVKFQNLPFPNYELRCFTETLVKMFHSRAPNKPFIQVLRRGLFSAINNLPNLNFHTLHNGMWTQ